MANQSTKLTNVGTQSKNTKSASANTSLQNQPIFVFQNMFVWSSKELKDYMSNNYVRVGLYAKSKSDIPQVLKGTMGGVDDQGFPKCLDTAILEIQEPRENKLFFFAEEFGRKTQTKMYSAETFDYLKELGKDIKNKIKGTRALIGLRNIAKALAPKPINQKEKSIIDASFFNGVDTSDPSKIPGPDLPNVTLANKKVICGRIQTLNSKMYDTLNIRQEFSSAIPSSVIDSCSVPAVKEYDVRNNNEILNLGKNLFDFESLVHVGYLDERDKQKWDKFLEDPNSGFLNQTNVSPTKNSYDAPNLADFLKRLPQFEYVWAMSLHRLKLNEYGNVSKAITNGAEKQIDDAKTVQYALYSNNHTTRLLETESTAESTNNKVSSTIFPYIRTFESPSLLTWMTKKDLEGFRDGLKSTSNKDKRLPNRVQESIAYYRYVNQGFVAIGATADVERIISSGVENIADNLQQAKKFETLSLPELSHQKQGYELTQGGSFAFNIFEKNARMLVSSDPNAKIDALNFVADDNGKFIDVRLPSAFYQKDGKSIKFPIDYALAYHTNSNVVLLSRTSDDGFINTFDGKNASQKENFKNLWLALNQNSNFTAKRESYPKPLEWADKVTISRSKCTPMRMLADTYYKLVSNLADKIEYNISKSGAGHRKDRVDKLDVYSAAIHLALLDPSQDLFKTPFTTRMEKQKFKRFMNVLRGVLFDAQSLFTKDISSFYNSNDRTNPIKGKDMTASSKDFKVLSNTRDFLPAIATDKPDDINLGLSATNSGNKITKQLFFDSVFFSNSVKDNLQPINLPIARPEDKNSAYKVAKFWTDSKNQHGEREYGRTLYVRTNATLENRLNADANAGHNVIAVAPFMDGAMTKINEMKKIKSQSIIPKVISLSDMESVLDCLHFYHRAAVGLGALDAKLDMGSQKDAFSVEMDSFLINPYTGTYTSDSKILENCGFKNTKVRAYESFVVLRKEYYAQRFIALLSCCLTNLKKSDVDVDFEPNTSTIIFEKAFGKMVRVLFLEKMKDVSNQTALEYFTKLLKVKDISSDEISIGYAFEQLVFFETEPFVRIVKRNHPSSNFFKFKDSPFELSRVYYTDSKIKQEVDAEFQRPYTYEIAYDSAKKSGIPLPNDKNSDQAKEMTKAYYANLSEKDQVDIYKKTQDMVNAQQVFLNSIMIPGLGIPPEWKEYICKKGQGMPMPTPKDSDKFLESIANTWASVGLSEKDVMSNLCNTEPSVNASAVKKDPPKTKVEDLAKNKDYSIPQNQLPMSTNTNQANTNQADTKRIDTNQTIKSDKNSKIPMIVGGAIGLSVIAYLGYKYLGNKGEQK